MCWGVVYAEVGVFSGSGMGLLWMGMGVCGFVIGVLVVSLGRVLECALGGR